MNVIQGKVQPQLLKTYSLEISMDHALAVHIDQAPCDVAKLWEPHNCQRQVRDTVIQMEDVQVQTDLRPDVQQ